MLKHLCPMCGTATIEVAAHASVCPSCQTSVTALKHVTVIAPRPMMRA